MVSSALASKRVFPTPRGEYYAALANLDGEHREHRSCLEVVSIQLQKPTLKEQVNRKQMRRRGKETNTMFGHSTETNEHVVLL